MRFNIEPIRINKCIAVLTLAFCAVTVAMVIQSSLTKYFTLDEALLATRGHMIWKEGVRGPEKVMGTEGLTHPPLYEATLALIFRLFGETELPARAFGVLIYLTVGALMLLTFRGIAADESDFLKRTGLGCCALLYLVNPLLLQHSMLVDAETTWTTVFSALFVFVFVRSERTAIGRAYIFSRVILALIFAAAFFGKEITPFFLQAGVFVYRLAARQWKKMAYDLVFLTALGCVFILAGIFLYNHLTGTQMVFFFQKQFNFRVGRATRSAFLMRSFLNSGMIARWPVFWASAPFFALQFFVTVLRIIDYCKTRKVALADYCLITAWIVWTPYFYIKPSIDMMKYQHPVYPFFILAIVFAFLDSLKPHEGPVREWFRAHWLPSVPVIAVAGLLGLHYYNLGDYITQLASSPAKPSWRALIFSYYWPLVLLVAAAIIFCAWKKKYLKAALLAVMIGSVVPVSLALDWRQKTTYVTVESWLNYGERGMADVIDYLGRNVRSENSVACRSDILYYLNFRKNLQPTATGLTWLAAFRNPYEMDAWAKTDPYDFVVIDGVSMAYLHVRPEAANRLLKYYRLDGRFGDFQVLRLYGK